MERRHIPGQLATGFLRILAWFLMAVGTIIMVYLAANLPSPDLLIDRTAPRLLLPLLFGVALPLVAGIVAGVFLLVVASIADNLIAVRWQMESNYYAADYDNTSEDEVKC